MQHGQQASGRYVPALHRPDSDDIMTHAVRRESLSLTSHFKLNVTVSQARHIYA